MRPSYAALHCLSNFSFLRAASHPEELIQQAAALNYAAIAITDECSVAGVVRAHVAAKEGGIKLIIGAEFVLQDAPDIERLVLLAQTREGYGNLCELITLARRRAEKGSYELMLGDVLLGVPECLAILKVIDYSTTATLRPLQQLRDVFPHRLWIGASLDYGADDTQTLDDLLTLEHQSQIPLVALEPVVMHQRDRKPLHDVITATRLHAPVSELGKRALAHSEGHLKPIAQLLKRYPPRLVIETLAIAAQCSFSLDEIRYEYPREVVPAEETPKSYLRKLTYEGMTTRYGAVFPEAIVKIVEHELRVIGDLQYEAFFLTIYDVVAFARSQGILCQGRGSAANSAVCYCLGITEVDPSRMQVLFERFISRERNEPPDIDVDFEHERREEVIQYLYRKYGRNRTALTAAVATYRPKSAIRDVGKALGLSLDQVDALSRAIVWWDGRAIAPERLREAGFDPDSPLMQKLLELTHELIGFPRHLSQHSGGFVIAREQLTRLVPVENAAMPERSVIQWDKDDLDELGLIKVDVLALGMLTAIRKTFDSLNRFYGDACSDTFTLKAVKDVPAEDAETYRMIQRADTIGVFQIESRAQMSMLPRLKPKCFYDLVIEVAIVRPGPIQGGMVHPYLKRRNGQEKVVYPSAAVEQVLKRTLGVSIFQEQVMQLAVIAAGFTPGEADRLRRAMAAWKRKGGIEPFREQLMTGMLSRGYTEAYAEQIYKQMQGFGEYGFPESHAASFALLVYISCYLKCHHPAAFTCGLLNSQPLGFYSPSQLVQDVKRHDVTVQAVDVMVSEWDCVLESSNNINANIGGHLEAEMLVEGRQETSLVKNITYGAPGIRLGLRMIKGLSFDAASRIVNARAAQPFTDIADVKRRAQLDEGDITALAAADAFATLIGNRREALWSALGTSQDAAMFLAPADNSIATLFAPTEASDILEDYRSTGLTLRRHPLALMRPQLNADYVITAAQLAKLDTGRRVRVVGIVTCRQRPSTAKGTTFVTLEDETGYVNVVVWASVAEAQRKALIFARLMRVTGRVERQGRVVHLIAEKLTDETVMLDSLLGELNMPSRDFH
jgi:error-prone DNA polymerase